ncbi:hypothetical protein MKW94_012248 [Papaver nudicaule]|uniref:Glycosyltransferase n=1 Tax=Papaver nudicaule TaxID=74823 RepID=A0AA41V908_PAPNU|nr:hypothetical protein [Papaver nudicaule]
MPYKTSVIAPRGIRSANFTTKSITRPLFFSFSKSLEMMKKTIVIYPSPLVGHLISMVELGKLILSHYPSYTITILITTMNPKTTSQTTPYINRISNTTPSVVFHHLPTQELEKSQTIFEYIHQNNPLVRDSLDFISQSHKICSFIFDMFCSASLEVTNQLQIASYFFNTSGVNAFTVLLHLPTLNNSRKSVEHDDDTHLEIPGLPPILSTDLPSSSLNPKDASHEPFMFISKTAVQAKGIIVNSFDWLESRAVKAIRGGLCNTNSVVPPLYPVGPLIAEPAASDETCECFTWLDKQPRESVVFLCFGSGGVFSRDQLNEIAVGLERSGKRFLWVVRVARPKDKNEQSLASPEPSLDELLPEGFLERTRERGLVVKNWASQVDVLNRESVGGFVTHCGWNSILESVCAGVPMIAWPLYAEQRVNRVALVKEMKLSLWLNESENGVVTAAEFEERVNTLMDSEEGMALKERVKVARDEAKLALGDGGSTRSALTELVESWHHQ